MIGNNCNYMKIHIEITTYKNNSPRIGALKKMNNEKNVTKKFNRANESNKFICSICLNAKPKCDETIKPEYTKRKSKSCPICQKGFDYRWESLNEKLKPDKGVKESEKIVTNYTSSTKTVQTSQTDVAQGLNLLNEVLTVFQSKKQICVERDKCNKTVILKDACVATENLLNNTTKKPVLTISKIFHLSIDENSLIRNNKFTIVNSFQPQRNKNSQYTVELIKHKSSSIPQMKLEELKHSLKEKTKSKDAIEEVNRMFATVRKNALHSLDDRNRPMTRNGPRVLPVVKTKAYEINRRNEMRLSDDFRRDDKKVNEKLYKFCQTKNYLMSSGDSFIRLDGCQHNPCEKICSKCVHAVRCHNGCRKIHDVCELCCQRCKDTRCHHHGCHEDIHDGDSCASF